MTPKEAPQPPAGTFPDRLRAFIAWLGGRIYATETQKHGPMRRGDLAELRRLDARRGIPSTGSQFWSLVVNELEPRGLLDADNEVQVRQWMTILQGLAKLGVLHRSKLRLGTAWKDADISEDRLTRLLRAEGDPLLRQASALAKLLHGRGQPVDWTEVAELVTSDTKASRESVRRRIARDYYRAVRAQNT